MKASEKIASLLEAETLKRPLSEQPPAPLMAAVRDAQIATQFEKQQDRRKAAARLLKALMPGSNRAARRAALQNLQRKNKGN